MNTECVRIKETNYKYLMFGYNSWADFKASNIGKWYRETLFIVTCVILTFWFGMDAILKGISDNVFSPATAFLMAMVTITADWMSGMYGAYQRGEFSTKKAQRILPKLLANAIFLAGYFHFCRHLIVPINADILTNIFEQGKVIIAAMMTGIHGLSFLSNCAQAELINGKFADWIKEKVDANKNKFNNLM